MTCSDTHAYLVPEERPAPGHPVWRWGSLASLALLIGIVLFATTGIAQAQQPDERAPTILEHLQDTEQWQEMDPDARMQMRQSLQPHGTPAAPQTSVAGFDVPGR